MKEFAGAQWCARFPASVSVDDLAEPFRGYVGRFLVALKAAGAKVVIAQTFRPPERAYLMHNCCMIVSGQDPASVPAMAGVDIDWTCGGDRKAAQAASAAMKQGYKIVFPAALQSRHTQRLAIDMDVTWSRQLMIKDGSGRTCMIAPLSTAPRGNNSRALWALGETYGVIKLPTDGPHWSSDGH